MGREVKRVALAFRWPLHMPWRGYVNPYSSQTCKGCDGEGVNPETKKIADDFYGRDYRGGWRDQITQDEVEALQAKGRLRRWNREGGWEKVPGLTAAEVNAAQARGFGGDFCHDAINRWILVETRARRLGVYGSCEFCGGDGEVWATEAIKAAHEAWEDFEPPAGPGWQVWETTSDGSPITPVFATPEELARWCADNAASILGSDTLPYEEWLAWFRGTDTSASAAPGDGGGTP
jgi:hypothetical protein